MDYQRVATFDELMSDSTAVEFHGNVQYFPVDKNLREFTEWVDADAKPNWGTEYEPMLSAVKRLVSESDLAYADAIAKIAALQEAADDASEEGEDPRDGEDDPEDDEDDDEDDEEDGEDYAEDSEDADGYVEDGYSEDGYSEDNPEDGEVPVPNEAARIAAEEIAVTIIAQLQEQYPEIAARLTSEQLTAAAMRATAAAVSEVTG